MRRLPRGAGLYKDFHAQIVHLGKEVCRKKPGCGECPVRSISRDVRCRFSYSQFP
jgi:endonuclease-3 related protein